MKEILIEKYESDGARAALELLVGTYIPHIEKVPLYHQLSKYAYWKAKDLTAAIGIGQAGINLAEKFAEEYPTDKEIVLSQEKAIHYDLASFTWPGWDEEGIEISEEQRRTGMTAARINLDLAISLHKPSLPLSRAYWMMGAHHLSAGEYTTAQARFALAAQTAREAESLPDELLSVGFGHLSALLMKPKNMVAREELDHVKANLLKEKDGEFFVKQLEDAERVFSR